MCEKNGARVSASGEILFRQVNPGWFAQDGEPSSQAFYPWREDDECCLSVDRASKTQADAAYTLFTAPRPAGFGGTSAGVWGISVQEVDDANVTAWDDPVDACDDAPANLAHGVVDFSDHQSEKKKRNVGRILKVKALSRGRVYP